MVKKTSQKKINVSNDTADELDSLKTNELTSFDKVIKTLLPSHNVIGNGTYPKTFVVALTADQYQKLRENDLQVRVQHVDNNVYVAKCAFHNTLTDNGGKELHGCTFKVTFN